MIVKDAIENTLNDRETGTSDSSRFSPLSNSSLSRLSSSFYFVKQSVKDRISVVKSAERGAADLKKRVEELAKSLEELEKEQQVTGGGGYTKENVARCQIVET